jgi:carboxylesterase type B
MNTNDSIESPYVLFRYVNESEYVKELNQTINGEGGHGVSKYTSTHRQRRIRALKDATKSTSPGSMDDLLERALKLYPPRTHGNNSDLVQWFQSDSIICSTLREVSAASKVATSAFMYRYNWFFQSDKRCVADSNWHPPSYGSIHCDEMSFVFGQPIFDNQDAPGFSYTNCTDPASVYYDKERCTGCHFNHDEGEFSFDIGRFWTEFARSGAPAKSDQWPAITPLALQNIYLQPGAIAVEKDASRTEACALWDEVHRRNGGVL